MKVRIANSEYEMIYGSYSAKAPYNYVYGNIGGYIDPIDKTITIHAFNIEDYTRQKKVFESVVWFELFSAATYERFKVELWDAVEVNADAFKVVWLLSHNMEELYEAFLDISVDINHYIFVNGGKR